MRISPAVGARKPAMILSSVDFPQPEGPTMQRNSEASILKLTPSTPGTRPEGVSQTIETSETSICGIGDHPERALIEGMPVCGQHRPPGEFRPARIRCR